MHLVANADKLPSRVTNDVRVFTTESLATDVGDATAVAVFNDTLEATGWTTLHVTTSASASDEAQAYAAGYVEGNVTALRILQGASNQGVNWTWGTALGDFLAQNFAFMRSSILANESAPLSSQTVYWHQISLVLIQLQGLFDGYTDVATAQNSTWLLPFGAFVNLQIGGDLEDLQAALGVQNTRAHVRDGAFVRVPFDAPRRSTSRAHGRDAEFIFRAADGLILRRNAPRGAAFDPMVVDGPGDHCSGIVRLLPGAADILSGQADWGAFEDMVRVFKRYTFPWSANGGSGAGGSVAATSVTFSGYPGTLFSADDFYALSSGLIVWETTIGNSNATLYAEYVRPATVLDWLRNIVANRLASNAGEWCATFGDYNSGTYNNQFAVVDANVFTPGAALTPGVFFVLEQLPGYIRFSDQTALLSAQGYFGSYNVPFDPFLYVISGEAALAQQFGPWFTYNATARANILRRDAPRVGDAAAFQRLMRYNDFQNDPLATQGCSGNPPSSAENAIAARDDLNPANGTYPISALGHRDHAAIDAKVASAAALRSGSLAVWAQAGPTHDQQPVFDWRTAPPDFAGIGHAGQPLAFNFSFVVIDM